MSMVDGKRYHIYQASAFSSTTGYLGPNGLTETTAEAWAFASLEEAEALRREIQTKCADALASSGLSHTIISR